MLDCASVAAVQEPALRDPGHTKAEEHADQVLTDLEVRIALFTCIDVTSNELKGYGSSQ